MIEDIKKSFLTGIGAVLLTKNKIEEITRQWVDESRISRDDADRLADALLEAGRNQWSSVETAVKDAARRTLSAMDVGSRRELEELKAEVANLQKRVEMLEDTRDTAGKQ